MRERLIHPIEHQLIVTPKTVLDLLNEHYDQPALNPIAELPGDREFEYIKYVTVLALNTYSNDAISLGIRAYHFAATVGDMVGYDRQIIKASAEFSSSQSVDELHHIVISNTDNYITANAPTIGLIDTYHRMIDDSDHPDVLAVRSITATIMRQMQQGNEEYAAARQLIELEELLIAQTDGQTG